MKWNPDCIDRYKLFGEIPNVAVERIAPGFFPQPTEREHLARYRWAARWATGQRVLDVACGTGYGSHILHKAGAKQVVGLDIHRPALDFALHRYPGPHYVQADAMSLPIQNGVFDVVVSIETLEHLSDPSDSCEKSAEH